MNCEGLQGTRVQFESTEVHKDGETVQGLVACDIVRVGCHDCQLTLKVHRVHSTCSKVCHSNSPVCPVTGTQPVSRKFYWRLHWRHASAS
eukprot:1157831-Pelagomonas_calceolata.AAC.8